MDRQMDRCHFDPFSQLSLSLRLKAELKMCWFNRFNVIFKTKLVDIGTDVMIKATFSAKTMMF